MVVGHLAVGLSAKRLSRNTSLVWFITAANLVDLIWPLFLLIGLERVRIDPGNTAFTPLAFDHYPWTHSLLAAAAWGVAFAVLARAYGVSRLAAMLAGALVMSHWILDLVTHRPDLPLSPWSDRVYGFGLWRSIPATLVVETLLWIAGIMLFLRAVRPRGFQGQIAFWSFVLASTIIWAGGPFSPPPPDVRSLATLASIGWIIVPWAWWIERTTEPR
jgi:hypothetical protein